MNRRQNFWTNGDCDLPTSMNGLCYIPIIYIKIDFVTFFGDHFVENGIKSSICNNKYHPNNNKLTKCL